MTDSTISSGAPNTAAPAVSTEAEPTKPVAEEIPQSQGETQDPPVVESENKEPAKEVPESYDLAIPEGAQLPESYLDDAATLAKEYGLTQEQAQALVERDAGLVQGYHDAVMAKHEAEVSGWADAVRNDPELGGDKFTATQEAARAAVARFGNDDLRTWLNDSGFGNHPMAVRFFAEVGKAIADDKPNLQGSPPQSPKSAASILYPTN